MIQILTYSGTEENLKGKNVIINKLHDAQSLDEFEINVIDLKSEYIWRNKKDNRQGCIILNDLLSLNTMICNSKKTKIVILFPQNIIYKYDYGYDFSLKGGKKYLNSCELKNMISDMLLILGDVHSSINGFNNRLSVSYENSSTKINKGQVSASFCFNNVGSKNILTQSISSEKVTTIKSDKIILSTLNIKSYEEMIDFLKQIHLIKEKEKVPNWIKNEKMFDDQEQLDLIEEKNKVMEEARKDINKAKEILNRNEKYKSILYTSGNELVDVVFEILQKMLGCNLSEFNDMKREDFNFKMDDNIFIGEIKGITSNVKSANVTQLEVHVQNYLDDYPEEKDNIISLLIIDHQRNRALFEREEVHETQIRLAERNGSLIVETITLLKMFEKYLNGVLSREKCIEILKNNKVYYLLICLIKTTLAVVFLLSNLYLYKGYNIFFTEY
ncbi:MAG: hypothetical protein KH032_11125 [[Clostridium] spiroforme]|uniref:hypothetical protein n=1 Tax=Thomasclavelia spiroformis TaxID=29348 RepID=UPI001D503EF9|nr:hypothetical protein [Thomasclavelia spiroformis]MBS7217778.1 hypothetical protein [Thomasclavelia spiroformis]